MKAFTSQKTMIASGMGIGLTAVLTVVSFLPRGAHGEFDLNALNQQVQDQQAVINNHEARITNNENDIKKLQDNTNTQPADHVSVPTATSTPTTAPTASQPAQTAPAPVVVPTGPKILEVTYVPDTCPNGPYYVWHMSDNSIENHPDSGGVTPSNSVTVCNPSPQINIKP